MNESELRKTLLLRAFEAQAPDDVWPERDRNRVSQAGLEAIRPARPGDPEQTTDKAEAFLAARAAAAEPQLLERDPQMARTYRSLRWRRPLMPLVIIGALIIGVLSDAIGNQRQINLLAPPLLGLLLWHAGLYLAMAGRALVPFFRVGSGQPGWLRKSVAHLGLSAGPTDRLQGRPRRYATWWVQASAPLTSARTATTLHLAAAALAAGTVSAMYARGLAFEFSAGWESTFLDAPQVAWLLQTVLGSASWLTGIALPAPADIAELAFARGPGENAARWIHLWATTVGLFVFVPRLIMGLITARRAGQLRRHLPHDFAQPYYDGLCRLLTGKAAGLLVVPYALKPDAQARQALETSFRRLYGSRSDVQMRPTVAFGDEDDYVGEAGDDQRELVAALFSLSATPERENQGEFLRKLAGTCGPSARLLVLIDEQSFRTRFAGNPDRLEQRRAAWQKMVNALGYQPVFIRLDPAQIENNLIALQATLTNNDDSAQYALSAATASR